MRKFVSLLLCVALLLSCASVVSAEDVMTLTWYNINPAYEDGTWGEQTFEEMFGVDVQIIRAESSDELATMLASGNIPDVIFAGSISDVATYQNLGILASVTEEEIKTYMPSYYDMCVEKDPSIFTYSMIDGVNYAITKLKGVAGIGQAAVIRADWLTAVGIDKVPSNLEELEAALYAFTYNDPDGNGINDTYGMSSGSDKENGKRFFSSIFGAYGINPFCWTIEDGEAKFGFTTDSCKEALKLLHKWYDMGIIDPEFVTDQCRTSGTDIAYKFANGKIGYIDGFNYDDYQWDNDGHVNAKWVAANQSWQDFFASSDDESVLYTYANVFDFSDDMINPYYIVLSGLEGPAGDDSGFYASSCVGGYICFGIQLEDDADKKHKAMEILEALAMDEDACINHYGPEGYIWEWNEDKTERVWIDNYSSKENYNAQGQIIGNGQNLWAMYACKPEFQTLIGGTRMNQRYNVDLPKFAEANTVIDAIPVALSSSAEYPDLIYSYVVEYMVKAIRGDVDIDSTWDSTIENWYKNGGTILTNEANAWYQGTK